ncbi:hypothetical protein QAD02_007078 [Eretmocerus hayati]|uniref:Uncharacterized protein n=1 Tax=Eretmocerus hayati TaxID=131215 RepID=A0ACC2N3E9_9HYME|nr:hypothetical protein QAD02_007078 [Eretmocerus hayati]
MISADFSVKPSEFESTKNNVTPVALPLQASEPLETVSDVASSEDSAIPTLRFPQKLWQIVNECKTGAITRGPGGYTVFVDERKFTAEFLTCENPLFKTRIFTSFVRQLNLYGFRKVTTSRGRQHNGTGPSCEFLHEHFRFGRLDLLSRVCRKACVKRNYPRQRKRWVKVEPDIDPITGLTKLEKCQIALTEALEQATRQYREEQLKFQRQSIRILSRLRKNHSSKVFEAEPNIKVVIGDMIQIVDVGNLPIIDASIIPVIANASGCEYQRQWEQLLTFTTENFAISAPQKCEKLESP